MRMDADFHQYCANVAGLYLSLKEAFSEDSGRSTTATLSRWQRRTLRKRRRLGRNLTDDELKERRRWLRDATLEINRSTRESAGEERRQPQDAGNGIDPSFETDTVTREEPGGFRKYLSWFGEPDRERDTLAARLEEDIVLLNRVLHALDRGDETFFLYLTNKVAEINDWLSENGLYWFGHKPRAAEETPSPAVEGPPPYAVEDQKKRIQEAWPWEGERASREKLRRQSREALKESALVFRSEDGKIFEREEARQKHQEQIDAYFEFCRQWEFQNKIKSWRDAEVEKKDKGDTSHPNDSEKSDAPNETTADGEILEELVYKIFKQPSNTVTLRKLADLLFRSPKNQSKLALLLGMPPSRWLREEEEESVILRRSFHRMADPVNLPDRPLRDVTGLCFSGGGIRSATFNLGVLQALAELHLLQCFDYLSTVSGGGYIHQWVAAWWMRASESAAPASAFQTVNRSMIAQPVSTLPGIEPTQVSFLRRFSNYLTPQIGAFSTDTWTMVAIWMRNTFLNQLILMSSFLATFGLLRLFLLGLETWTDHVSQNGVHYKTVTVTLTAFLAFFIFVAWRLRFFASELDHSVKSDRSRHRDGPIVLAITSLLCSAVFYTVICGGSELPVQAADEDLWQWLLRLLLTPIGLAIGSVLFLWPVAMAYVGFTTKNYRDAHPRSAGLVSRFVVIPASAAFAAVAVFLVLALTFRYLQAALPTFWYNHLCVSQNRTVQKLVEYISNHSAIFCDLLFLFVPPVLVAALFLVSVLHIGLNRRVFRDEVLEWMARLRALGFLISFAWLAVGGCLILSAPLVGIAPPLKFKAWSSLTVALWGAISGGGALAAKNKPDASDSRIKQYGRQALIQIAPYVFIVGIFISISSIVSLASEAAGAQVWKHLTILCAGSLIFFVLYGLNVDINEFSMHSFYRNRLARCYQGASVIDRRPDEFTGFSCDDRTIRLGDLRFSKNTDDAKGQYPGPFPIFCCTLNFTSGEDLAWQERKGASFAFTPLYSGYDIPWTGIDRKDDQYLYYNGFRDTSDLAHPRGPGLADACAISGAAVSPNWGYHTTPGMAFLMTCFNVRLGVWKRNTRYPTRTSSNRNVADPRTEKQSPRFAPWHLLLELLGKTNAKNEFLYLTDGGHFDNMGLYELVRRGCRYIVVCDAEQDEDLAFEGIAMALRKCRTDFGVEIDLDLRAIRKLVESGLSSVHCVVGTILYPNEDPETPGRDRGKIVYLKSTLTGGEPADILSYKLEHSEFPHDKTADQWFSESQFESYRVLGRFIGLTSLKPACEEENGVVKFGGKRRAFFNHLYDVWYPVTPAIEQHLSEHGEKFDALLRELRSKENYAIHANEIFEAGNANLSEGAEGYRDYFQAFAHSLFEFMWRVFNDLDLQIASNRAHPQGQIWMNTFRRWAEMLFVQQAWPKYKDRYPASFHFFLREHLEFKKPGTTSPIDLP
jgi:Patatin-like phospholipase